MGKTGIGLDKIRLYVHEARRVMGLDRVQLD